MMKWTTNTFLTNMQSFSIRSNIVHFTTIQKVWTAVVSKFTWISFMIVNSSPSYIYIYIYTMCVCVCVCVCASTGRTHNSSDTICSFKEQESRHYSIPTNIFPSLNFLPSPLCSYMAAILPFSPPLLFPCTFHASFSSWPPLSSQFIFYSNFKFN